MGKDNKNSNSSTDVKYYVESLYSLNDLQKLMSINTIAAFKESGLKCDPSVSYTRILFYLLLNSIGFYTTFFLHIESSKRLLEIAVFTYFSLLLVLTIFDKIVLKGAALRLLLKKTKILVSTAVNWKEGTFEIKYRQEGKNSQEKVHAIPLGDLFYTDGECDYVYFKKEIEALNHTLVSLDKTD
ncbi:conserved hypothetical protein [Theileria equi strain WA]|uniref:Signal peptidase complex subunit 2 n=1 Tax=Theileria equi strain WA TaxID=1537102 RepID=L1LD91_THEEQ|nr:conserved hypothetical protein [Theileria equi strain WA]EKX73143.1 conserved hypothetical protein [Theileria equi strain WA]|eukprot:XP_004832595.1 conserved hypothetical protein [Theileria equi strain WA]